MEFKLNYELKLIDIFKLPCNTC